MRDGRNSSVLFPNLTRFKQCVQCHSLRTLDAIDFCTHLYFIRRRLIGKQGLQRFLLLFTAFCAYYVYISGPFSVKCTISFLVHFYSLQTQFFYETIWKMTHLRKMSKCNFTIINTIVKASVVYWFSLLKDKMWPIIIPSIQLRSTLCNRVSEPGDRQPVVCTVQRHCL